MVFQDFDHISERRRLERERKFRKRVAIASILGVVFLLAIAGGVFAVVTGTRNGHVSGSSGGGGNNNNTPTQANQQAQPAKTVSNVARVIKTVCNDTTYKTRCEDTLKKAVEKTHSSGQPKDLLKLAIKAADDAFEKALDKASTFKFHSPKEKAAFEDCEELIKNAKDELKESVSHAGDDIAKLAKNVPELNNWLSAVMSYEQTCIDGFPEGKLRNDMENTLKASKELTSNCLAMVSSLASFLSQFQIPAGTSRHLLAKESNFPSLDEDGLPCWMNHEERRMLKGTKKDKPKGPKPNVIVAKDGSGNFTTVSAALAAIPAKYPGRYVIYVKTGIYDESVTVTNSNVTMYGDGSQKSIITGRKNFADGVQTYRTATVAILGEGFLAKAMGFRNTAGPEKHQAVAVRVQADRSIFLNCRFEGYQDTLYAQTHRQFYRSCVISGTIDFIFGDAAAIFQNCLVTLRKPLENQQNIITAQGRVDKFETTGIVLQNCRIEPDKALIPVKDKIRSYLGRPWKEYSRTVVMESTIGDFIHPEGWLAWEGEKGLKTLFYAEYKNKGPGSKTSGRVKWPGYHVIDQQKAMKYTVGPFLQGEWITATGSPVHFGLF